jgi:hypothetical protein
LPLNQDCIKRLPALFLFPLLEKAKEAALMGQPPPFTASFNKN